MRYVLSIIMASLLTVIMTMEAFGDAPADSVKVYFIVGHSRFNPDVRDNRAAMDRFIHIVNEAQANDNIQRIVVSGYASPDGISTANERLSRLRCESVADYLVEHTGVRREDIQTVAGGVAWDELRRLVEENPDVPSRKKILDILDYTPLWIFDKSGNITSGRKARLMSLERGEPYRWMLIHLFPELRNAIALAVFLKREMPEKVVQTDTSVLEVAPEVEVISETSEISEVTETSEISESSEISEISKISVVSKIPGAPGAPGMDETAASMRTQKPFYMGVKTNMLFDAALIPNIGAEFYLGKNLSIYGEWMYAWWDNNARHRYWRTYGGDIGLRWWFGRKAHSKPLTGHHLGVYGGILTFDVENGDTGYLGGKPGGTLWDRWLVNTGIEYGYSLPVGKRINIDFSIGLGYMGGNYIKYFPFDNDYYFDKEYSMHFFGPTKAEISLVWLIGRGNTKGRKGGDR